MSTSIDPYEPPRSDLAIPALARPPRDLYRALKLFLVAIALLFGGGFLAVTIPGRGRWLGTLVMAAGDVAALLGVYCASTDTWFVAGARMKGRALWGLGLLATGALNLFIAFSGTLMTLMSTSDFRRGRQLRRRGRVLLPRVEAGSLGASWTAAALPGRLSPEYVADARVTAAQWRDNGRTEHASVAAFAALSTDLMSVGAPPSLIAAASRDALDEIRHTELCFSLARALDGQKLGPGPFPDARRGGAPLTLGRTHALARLAVDSLVDGALHEGVSARVLAKLARRCGSPVVADMVKQIARDEGRHAAHGWDVVVWCVEEGGSPVVHALEASLRALPDVMTSPLPEAARDGGWERFGIHGSQLEEDEYIRALQDLRRRVAGLGAEIVAEAC